MTHPSRVLNLDMKAKLCMPKSYIYILSPFLDWPKKGDEGLRQRVHRKLQNDIYAVKEIHDPTVGQPKKQIVEKVTY